MLISAKNSKSSLYMQQSNQNDYETAEHLPHRCLAACNTQLLEKKYYTLSFILKESVFYYTE